MIKYHSNILDFWTEELTSYKFTNSYSVVGQNPDISMHPNYNNHDMLQAFDDEIPNYKKFFSALNVLHGTMSWSCLEPGKMIFIHRDKFYKVREKFNVNVTQCLRYLIFLGDWKFGQFVQFENADIGKWNKGDVWVFDSNEQHWGSNASHDNFYTCQVNTFKMVDNQI